MTFERSSGILLHPTSLPNNYGIGDLGPEAFRWVNFLSNTGCKLWQVLPLGPTGYGDSPYQCFSAFAGNPYLISLDLLLNQGLLTRDELSDMPVWPLGQVDFGAIYQWKPALLDKVYDHFEQSASTELREEFAAFCTDNAAWLDDFVLFMSIKDTQGGVAWGEWPPELRDRELKAMAEARKLLAGKIARQSFRQWLFFRQWKDLRKFAHEKGIKIIGDIPIFVAYDSADAWSNRDLFYFDEVGQPTVVAGVPPDYFSPTGQLWGNPLYRWDVHKATGYVWWIERIKAMLTQVDIIRIDHFRGFAGYWEVPGGAKTAEKGRWVPGPGADLFTAIRSSLGDLPILAEDLGEITPDVVELRDKFNLPGMKILQFGFSGPDNPFLPHHYPVNCVAYSGSHDNDTARGWYATAPENERVFYRRYLARDGSDFAWDLIRAIWSSTAMMAIAPLQDFMRLGGEARMNYPGRLGGNWTWRLDKVALNDGLALEIKNLNYLYQR